MRIEADVDQVGATTFTPANKLTGQDLSIPRANGLSLEFGFFWGGRPLDCSIYSSVQFHLWNAQNGALLLMAQILAQGSPQFQNALDPNGWVADTAQHAQFIFGSQDTNISLNGADAQVYWFEVKALVTATGNWVTLCEGNFTINESQAEQPATPVPLPPDTNLGTLTARATYVQRHGDAARTAWNNTDEYRFDAVDGLWHRYYANGGQMVLEQPGVAAVPQP